MSSLSLVIITMIPQIETIKPRIWNLLVFSTLNKKQSKIIIAGIAALKREAFITCVCIRAKYVNELNKPTLVKAKKNNNQILNGIENETDFYFVHSYIFKVVDEDRCITITDYGSEFVSIINQDNIYGVQFHPEKSHRYGEQLLNNFAIK